MDKIFNITGEGVVTFLDRDKGTEVAGTKQACEAYGYKHVNGVCYLPTAISTANNTANKGSGSNFINGVSNHVQGKGNTIIGNDNAVTGRDNFVQAGRNSVDGCYLYSELPNAIVYGNYNTENRARNVIFTYDGSTTDAVATELFSVGNRLRIDETYEAAFFIKATLVSINPVSNTCAQHEYWSQFKFANSTLTRTANITLTAGLGDVALGLELDAVADSPDYIRARVTGRASETWYHNLKLEITEVKYA